MNLPTNTCDNGACAFAIRGEYDKRVYRQRRCAWCINCADGCATTIRAHYHKAGAINLIGETYSTKETGVIEIWEV